MKKYKDIFFDLDGTLMDTEDGIVKSIMYAVKELNIDVSSADLLEFIGPPLTESFNRITNNNEELTIKAVKLYRERYESVGLLECSVYDGVSDMLQALNSRGYRLSIVTSKPEVYAKRLLEHLDMLKLFDEVYGALFGSREEKFDVMSYAMEHKCREKDTVIMIGDRKYDLGATEKMGIDAIGVLYGFGNSKELGQYPNLFLANNVKQIIDFFE